MKKILICIATVCLISFSACGEIEDKTQDSVSASGKSAEFSVQSDVPESEENLVTVFFDNNKLHDGVKFDDSEFVSKVLDFSGMVLKNYQTTNDCDEEALKGVYLKIEQSGSEAHSLYINQGDSNFVKIDGDIYETTGGETAEFYEYATGYLKDKGYMD